MLFPNYDFFFFFMLLMGPGVGTFPEVVLIVDCFFFFFVGNPGRVVTLPSINRCNLSAIIVSFNLN